MEECEFTKGKFQFNLIDYKKYGQRLIGITINSQDYGDDVKEYQFNVWLWRYGFHITLYK